MKKILLIASLLAASLLAGCASVPMAPLEQDQQAKQFQATPGSANIYLYRNENFGGAISMPVTLDGKLVGRTGPRTYFMWTVAPGKHEIASLTENTAKITIDAQAGKNHFVWQEVKMGVWAARSQLQEVPEAQGKQGVSECKLAEPAGE